MVKKNDHFKWKPFLEKLTFSILARTPKFQKLGTFFLGLEMSSDRLYNLSTYVKFGGKIIKNLKIDFKLNFFDEHLKKCTFAETLESLLTPSELGERSIWNGMAFINSVAMECHNPYTFEINCWSFNFYDYIKAILHWNITKYQ